MSHLLACFCTSSQCVPKGSSEEAMVCSDQHPHRDSTEDRNIRNASLSASKSSANGWLHRASAWVRRTLSPPLARASSCLHLPGFVLPSVPETTLLCVHPVVLHWSEITTVGRRQDHRVRIGPTSDTSDPLHTLNVSHIIRTTERSNQPHRCTSAKYFNAIFVIT